MSGLIWQSRLFRLAEQIFLVKKTRCSGGRQSSDVVLLIQLHGINFYFFAVLLTPVLDGFDQLY